MTTPDLNAIKSRLGEATPGISSGGNTKFIAHAHTDVDSLVAEVERLQRLLGHYQQAINKIDDYFECRNESKKDRDKVHGILESLTAEMKKGEV
jgi:hypothetical protein